MVDNIAEKIRLEIENKEDIGSIGEDEMIGRAVYVQLRTLYNTFNNLYEAIRVVENMFYTRESIDRYRRTLRLESGPVEPEKRKKIGRDQRERILVQLNKIGELEERLDSLGMIYIPENYVRRIQQIQEDI